MKNDEVKEFLARAIARVSHADRYLLDVDASERCIAARLAMYLREDFVGYDVDVEYNRAGAEIKRLMAVVCRCPRDRIETEGQRVLPDVIVHRRGDDKSNLLVIEVKKSSDPRGVDCDHERLEAFRAELRYKFGALVVCTTGKRPRVCAEFYPPIKGGV